MCGITLLIPNSCHSSPIPLQALKDAIHRRGPDFQGAETTKIHFGNNSSLSFSCAASVLHIQGNVVARQPFIDDNGNILLWNGEIWNRENILNLLTASSQIFREDDISVAQLSDTIIVHKLLTYSMNKSLDENTNNVDPTSASVNIVESLAAIHGPYSFVYFHLSSSTFHYGRDPFGRRSLLRLVNSSVNNSDNGGDSANTSDAPIILCSVSPNQSWLNTDRSITGPENSAWQWEEVPTVGICSFTLKPSTSTSHRVSAFKTTPWPASRVRLRRSSFSLPSPSQSLSHRSSPFSVGFTASSQQLFDRLFKAVSRRVACMSTMLQLQTQTAGTLGPRSAFAYSQSSLKEGSSNNLAASPVGVLFSGGLDSVILAALLHLALQTQEHDSPSQLAPIELINVSFFTNSNDKVTMRDANPGSNPSPLELLPTLLHSQGPTVNSCGPRPGTPSPDRLTAVVAMSELERQYPTRPWRLVHVDVDESERRAHEGHIRSLIRPSDTQMDLNIGSAFWFASRGVGYTRRYSADEVTQALAAEEVPGRPMVRVGAEGAARSVGLKQNPTIPLRSVDKSNFLHLVIEPSADEVIRDLSTCMGLTLSKSDRTTEIAHMNVQVPKPGIHKGVRCTNNPCKNVSKVGCARTLCSKCCVQWLHGQLDNPCPLNNLPGLSFDPHSTEDAATKLSVQEYTSETNETSSADSTTILNVPVYLADAQPTPPFTSPITRTCHVHKKGVAKPMPTATPADSCVISKNRELSNKHLHHAARANSMSNTYNEISDHCVTQFISNPASISTDTSDEACFRIDSDEPAGIPTTSNNPLDIPVGAADAAGVSSRVDKRAGTPIVAAVSAGTLYTCSCKALLVGIGADEQMAGYSRHRSCFTRGGAEALEAELNTDLQRLWTRNLGRDDRCIADNGRDAWFPYLDEDVVSYLQMLALDDIVNMSEPAGVGDKKILRLVAKQLGLAMTAEFVKRAIQFGTRVAKITNEQCYGSRRKGKGQYKISEEG